MKILSFLIAATAALAAYANLPAEQAPLSAKSSGPLGQGKRLKGEDANADGVRDDVEGIIAKRYPNHEQRAAAMQYARSHQAVFDLPVGDKVAANRVKVLAAHAMACLLSRFDGVAAGSNPLVVAKSIESMTFNSKARRQAYAQYNKAWLGTDWSSDDRAVCDSEQG